MSYADSELTVKASEELEEEVENILKIEQDEPRHYFVEMSGTAKLSRAKFAQMFGYV